MPEAGWARKPPNLGGIDPRGRSWVSAPPAVRSGDQVLVVVSSGTVRLTDRGVAAQDGCIGDRIKVRLSGESREVRGTISGPGLVEIFIGRRK